MDAADLLNRLLRLTIFDGNTFALANATNNPAIISLAPNNERWHIGMVTVGYSAAPTNGLLTINDGGNPIFVVPITSAGPTTLAVFRRGGANNGMSLVLSAGGSGIVGYINAEVISMP